MHYQSWLTKTEHQAGLSLVQKKVKRSNYLDFDEEIIIGVREMENAFIQHFDDRSIKVPLKCEITKRKKLFKI